MATQDDKRGKMKGGVRKNGPSGSWSYSIYLGMKPAQRCQACRHREWIGRQPLSACPKCGGVVDVTKERRQLQVGGFADRNAAMIARGKALERWGLDDYQEPEKLTLAAFLETVFLPRFTAQVEQGDRKPLTLESYRHHVRDHLIGPSREPFPLGQMELRRLNAGAILAHYDDLREGFSVERKGKLLKRKGLGPASVRRVHATLHRALDRAKVWGYVSGNAADIDGSDLPSEQRTTPAAWTYEELGKFLDGTAGDSLHLLWRFLAVTGMRRGEALGLLWEDVDLDKSKVLICRSRVPVSAETDPSRVMEVRPKTDRERSVSLDPPTVKLLREHLLEQKKDSLAGGYRASGHVFTDEHGQPLNPSSVTWQFRVAVKRLGLRWISLHGLRHTHITLLISDGQNPVEVAARVGHANTTMTLNVYAHALPGRQDAIAAGFGEKLGNARS